MQVLRCVEIRAENLIDFYLISNSGYFSTSKFKFELFYLIFSKSSLQRDVKRTNNETQAVTNKTYQLKERNVLV